MMLGIQRIELLKRGEKFEKMWREIREYLLNDLDDDYLESVELKYFPKSVKKIIKGA